MPPAPRTVLAGMLTLLALLALTPGRSGGAAQYTWVRFADPIPGAFDTTLADINDAGTLLGNHLQLPDNPAASFLWHAGTYTPLTGLLNFTAEGLNNHDQVVGAYSVLQDACYGYLWQQGQPQRFCFQTAPGSFSTAAVTTPMAINDAGQVVGFLGALLPRGILPRGEGIASFLFDPARVSLTSTGFRLLDLPFRGGGVVATGLNNAGTIVGYYNIEGVRRGFRIDGGTATHVDVPGALATMPRAINNHGAIVGQFIASDDEDGVCSFVYEASVWTTLVLPEGGCPQVKGINDAGVLVATIGGQGYLGTPVPVPLPPVPPVQPGAVALQGDVDGDGQADLLWHHPTTGQLIVWLMRGGAPYTGLTLLDTSDPRWHIERVADFDGDGRADLLWRHGVTGDLALWLMHGTTVATAAVIGYVPDTAWQIIGAGDVDGDGAADILWQHLGTGQVAAWLMAGTHVKRGVVVSPSGDLAWDLVALGDLDGDGTTDLVWRHLGSGTVVLWTMHEGQIARGDVVAQVPDPLWQLVGAGDVDGAGTADLLWRHQTTGDVVVWQMAGATVVAGTVLGQQTDLAATLVGVQDLNGDGTADLLWQHPTSGMLEPWLLQGPHILAPAAPLASATP